MKTLIIDGDNHLYRAAFKFHNFTNIDGKPSGVIYGVLSMITGMIRQFKPDNVVVVFDGKKSELRKLWLPGYKDRKDKNLKINYKEVLAQKEFLVTFLPLLGIEVIRSPHDEADDMIYLVTKKYRGTQKIIASRDKDFNQLITPKTWVYDGVEQVMLKPSNLKRRRGYTPKQCVDYLCLLGDSSDNIPGYPGIGEKKAADFLEKFESIQSFLDTDDTYGKINKEELRKIYELNRKLIDLKFYQTYLGKNHLHKNILNPVKPKASMKKAQAKLIKYEIKFLQKEENIKVFKKLIKAANNES